ncbi:MAG: sigma-54 dependent transcriptional regulator [Myxococcota bacterium]
MDILVIDDKEAVCTALEVLFEIHDLPCRTTTNPEEALALIADEAIGVVVQDMNFTDKETSGEEGVALFRAIRQLDPDLPVILMTAFSSLETAVELVKEGAIDYISKPWDDDKLLATVQNLLQMRELKLENSRLRAASNRARVELARRYDLCGLVYASDAMHELVSLAVHVARADVPILITGSNGTGKEMIANIIHANSRRAGKPFIKVNAGALPENLMEAELFGAETGAFTGANKLRIGRFEAAHGGTLFLDELGNLPLSGQMKLLRVLESGEFERLGSNTTRKVDVRLVSATNADLHAAIDRGTFRQDLYFRLNVIELRLKTLALRPDDIIPLAEHFLATFSPDPARPAWALSDATRRLLVAHHWPGNVRELHNRIQRATLVSGGSLIEPQHLDIGHGGGGDRGDAGGGLDADEAEERREVVEALERNHGVISRASADLGISRQALYRKLDRLRIVRRSRR